MAEILTSRFFKRLDVAMICAIAEIESARQPLAYRYEKRLQEASTGLMQTLQSTAEWLSTYILIVPPSFSHRFVFVCEGERQTDRERQRE
jgi:2,3-bisphosphoglycerate-independent phosphoglycerate mutase